MNKQNKKRKTGRPYAITKEKEEMLINMMADGMTQARACLYVGICEQTIIRHKERFSEFSERLERARLETTRLAHKSIRVGMLKDWKAGAWWLERTEPERFGLKKEIEIKNQPILIDDIMGKIEDSDL